MGYCKPIPLNAQRDLDRKVSECLRDMHSRGERVRTLEDMFKEHGRP